MFTARYVLHSTFCPHSVFMCFVWIWEQTAIISLYSIDWLVFITEMQCGYCAVRTGSSNLIEVNFSSCTSQLSIPSQSMRELRRTNWHWDGVFSSTSVSPCQYNSTIATHSPLLHIHRCSTLTIAPHSPLLHTHHCSTLTFVYTLLSSQGQTAEQRSFRNREALDTKILPTFSL